MPVPRQLDILKALTEHLEGISVVGGYSHDLAGRVFRGRMVFGDDVPLPCVSILEAPRPDERPRAGGHENAFRAEDWVLLVQGWVEDDAHNPTDPAYMLKADVELCLSQLVAINEQNGLPRHPSAFRLGGRISGATIGPGVVRPPQDRISAKAFFYIPLVLNVALTPTAPFVA